MRVTRRPAIVIFVLLGICLVGLAIVLNVGWIILNWRRMLPLVLGVPIFLLLIAGVVVNTVFLVREVRRNERQNNFLNAVTHELKTPIASIRLYLETLQRHNVAEEKRQEFYAIMLADSERLLSTVEQVLKAGEIAQRAGRHAREELDLVALVRGCIAATVTRHHLGPDAIVYEPAANDRPGDGGAGPGDEDGPAVDEKQDDDGAGPGAGGAGPGASAGAGGEGEPEEPEPMRPIRMSGNAEDLETAVLNILGNAVKYSPNGVRARVRIMERGDWVVLQVSDSGIGIARAHLKSVFKRFYRVPNRMVLRTKGTGLGLFLVRSIARQHGGDARAQSSGEGLGTTITLELPRGLRPGAE